MLGVVAAATSRTIVTLAVDERSLPRPILKNEGGQNETSRFNYFLIFSFQSDLEQNFERNRMACSISTDSAWLARKMTLKSIPG